MLLKFIKQFSKIKFVFNFPRKNKILLFDEIHSDVLKETIKKDFNILEFRKKKIYFWIYIRQIIFFDFTFKTYCKNYIKFTSPSVVICFNLLRFQMYELKKFFKNIYFISMCNGNYNDSTYKVLKKIWPKNLECDYIFTFNKYHIPKYKKLIKCNNFPLFGHYKNNLVKINKTKFNKQFLYLSILFDTPNGINYHLNNYHKRLLNLINLYLINYNKKIHILLRSSKKSSLYKHEINYYKNIFQSNCIFHASNNYKKKYTTIDWFENIIFTFTAMGYEAIARKKKVAVFAPHTIKYSTYNYNIKSYFGWPGPDKKKFDFFSTKKLNYKEVERVLNNVNNCTQSYWNKRYYTAIKDQCYLDKNNESLKSLILKLSKN